jgi:hypothetical protein
MEEPDAEANYLNNSFSITKNDHQLAESYTFQDFDPSGFMDLTGGVCLLVSPTGAGKTVLLRHILSVIGDGFKNHYMFSNTAHLQDAYDFYPRELITRFNEEKLEQIWAGQQTDKESRTLLIMDDIIADPAFQKSKMIPEVAFGGRHVGLMIIILSQNFTSIKPAIRNNARIAISFALSSKKETEKFVEAFMATVSNRVGYLVFRKITGQKYRAVIVCNYKVGEAFTERVYQFTADPDVVIDFFEKRKKPKKVTKAEIKELRKEFSRMPTKF